MEIISKWLHETVQELVNDPAQVSITESSDDRGELITLTVDPEDVGRVLGRQGQTARALRVIIHAMGAKEGKKVSLKIHDPRPPKQLGGQNGDMGDLSA